jgi:hypothetical protein
MIVEVPIQAKVDSDDDGYDEEEDSMTHQIMTFWLKHQPKLIHDYSLVGYTFSPHP